MKCAFLAPTLIVFLATQSLAAAPYVQAVLTSCNGPKSSFRELPSGTLVQEDRKKYTPLAATDAAFSEDLVASIVGNKVGNSSEIPQVSEVPAVYISFTGADGNQMMHQKVFPVAVIRKAVTSCVVSPAQSLGAKGDLTYAMVSASCPAGEKPWNLIRFGIGIKNKTLNEICANLGDPPNVFPPSSRDGQRKKGGHDD